MCLVLFVLPQAAEALLSTEEEDTPTPSPITKKTGRLCSISILMYTILYTGSFLENLPRGGQNRNFGYEGGRGSIHGNMGLHAF